MLNLNEKATVKALEDEYLILEEKALDDPKNDDELIKRMDEIQNTIARICSKARNRRG